VLDHVGALAPPPWLPDALLRGRDLALVSEISRREFLIAPVLLACRELLNNLVSMPLPQIELEQSKIENG